MATTGTKRDKFLPHIFRTFLVGRLFLLPGYFFFFSRIGLFQGRGGGSFPVFPPLPPPEFFPLESWARFHASPFIYFLLATENNLQHGTHNCMK